MDKRIYLCLAHMSGKEQKFIQEAFDTNWVVPLGPNVNGFEEDLKRFVNGRAGANDLNKEIVALSAGTAAIHLALIACGVQADDEVICQSFTFCASANPVTYLGASPSKFTHALNSLMKNIQKIDPLTGRVTEAFKKGHDALKEWANVTFDKLSQRIQRLKKAVEGGFLNRKALEDEFQNLSKELKLQIVTELEPTRGQYRDKSAFLRALLPLSIWRVSPR